MKFIFALILGWSPAVLAFQDVVFSPVQITDYRELNKFFEDFDGRQDTRAFRDLIYIVYDQMIERPWEEKYFPELQQRWQNVRSHFCPQLENLCRFSGELRTDADLHRFKQHLLGPASADLRQHFAQPPTGLSYSYDRVKDLAIEPGLFNVISAGTAQTQVLGHVELFDMSLAQVPLKELGAVMIHDLVTYQSSYGNDPSRTYLALGGAGEIILNSDRIKAVATHFAKIWKSRVEGVYTSPEEHHTPTLANADEFLMAQLFERHARDFQLTYLALVKRLNDMPAEQVGDVKDRFRVERLNGRYPEEVYQWVAYGIFRELIQTQGEYYRLAQAFRPTLNPKRRAWESLLSLETKHDPLTVLTFTYYESTFPKNFGLNQFIGPDVAQPFFWEMVKAILEDKEFVGRDNFARFHYALELEEVFAPQFLKETTPEAYEILKYPGTETLRPIKELSLAEQKLFYRAYLYTSTGEVRRFPFYRLITSMVTLLRPEHARDLALEIHQVREREFREP